jgi:hypothetical protein
MLLECQVSRLQVHDLACSAGAIKLLDLEAEVAYFGPPSEL